MGASMALPLMSFMSFVGGSLGSAFKFDEVVEVTCVGVMHAEDMMTGDEDLFSFDSFLRNSEKKFKNSPDTARHRPTHPL